ncbi:helix-turn-helix domain-containing protein [Streptomonospora wellingtoniae]|uniref:Helix-turn-helix domain-containing protein n=1 Tax=Streptomonospora wellingtoniae TaxID=3075544 RepID=A0ABU2KSU3_9ACTN|nr:helix-turn-helix domain-containing protein [Streptomonospora sp. DSM 45055]MDT0302354.1 helix-turn-helix domain-containing protein [Streptomonospora sp. DSM 45055]
MARLTRAETQRRNRARVLSAARAEFAERGFHEAGIDAIAERAELTRGAVYSNFPGKRALYFEVLADLAEDPAADGAESVRTAGGALGALARAWVARLPLATDADDPAARIGAGTVPEILADEPARRAYAQLVRFQAVLLGCGLERLRPPAAAGERRVRMAETALTTLHGASRLAAAAPGFGEPFNVVSACERLAALDLGDRWDGPAIVPEPHAADEPWAPPAAFDALRREPAPLAADGVVAILGLHRFSAAEDVLRAAPEGAEVTAVAVSGSPAELGPLARMAVADIRALLRRALPPGAWPRLRVVCDESGDVAAAAGVGEPGDATETAVRVEAGRITVRAEGLGAGHAAAGLSRGRPRRRERDPDREWDGPPSIL